MSDNNNLELSSRSFGIIGFFDILGYQNFLENNSEIDYAEKIIDMVLALPQEAIDSLKKNFSSPLILEATNNIKHLIFSDTIVITIDLKPKNIEIKDYEYSVYEDIVRDTMVLLATKLTSQMFALGLPIRGVLHEGEYLIKKYCLAGKAIVQAYQLCEKLNFSGAVCSEVFEEKYINRKNDPVCYKLLFFYLTPLKSITDKKMLNCNWMHYFEYQIDIEDFVLNAFWKHEKDCDASVDIKIHNTAKSIRKMQQIIRAHEQSSS